uniref:Putative secreted protein n=1 Tax=Anopheles darlingi TaxID=43151 RepID=A0A2M4D6E3_ANODA
MKLAIFPATSSIASVRAGQTTWRAREIDDERRRKNRSPACHCSRSQDTGQRLTVDLTREPFMGFARGMAKDDGPF